jgi:hypothetical protein
MSRRLSECYFANKGSAAVLCSLTSHQQQQQQPQQQPRRKRHHHHSLHPHRHQSLSAPASSRLSSGEDEMQTRANDIQAHLQSMFHILRPDDSLNMVSYYGSVTVWVSIGIYYCCHMLFKKTQRTLKYNTGRSINFELLMWKMYFTWSK